MSFVRDIFATSKHVFVIYEGPVNRGSDYPEIPYLVKLSSKTNLTNIWLIFCPGLNGEENQNHRDANSWFLALVVHLNFIVC